MNFDEIIEIKIMYQVQLNNQGRAAITINIQKHEFKYFNAKNTNG